MKLAFQKLVAEALRYLPADSPEWTDYNRSDPGITLVQFFAWVTEMLRYRGNGVPESSRSRFRRVAARLRRGRRSTRLLISGADKQTRAAAARFIARSLGLSLRRVDLSSVVGKYIGETE